jgi:hypothetical protein
MGTVGVGFMFSRRFQKTEQEPVGERLRKIDIDSLKGGAFSH